MLLITRTFRARAQDKRWECSLPVVCLGAIAMSNNYYESPGQTESTKCIQRYYIINANMQYERTAGHPLHGHVGRALETMPSVYVPPPGPLRQWLRTIQLIITLAQQIENVLYN